MEGGGTARSVTASFPVATCQYLAVTRYGTVYNTMRCGAVTLYDVVLYHGTIWYGDTVRMLRYKMRYDMTVRYCAVTRYGIWCSTDTVQYCTQTRHGIVRCTVR